MLFSGLNSSLFVLEKILASARRKLFARGTAKGYNGCTVIHQAVSLV